MGCERRGHVSHHTLGRLLGGRRCVALLLRRRRHRAAAVRECENNVNWKRTGARSRACPWTCGSRRPDLRRVRSDRHSDVIACEAGGSGAGLVLPLAVPLRRLERVCDQPRRRIRAEVVARVWHEPMLLVIIKSILWDAHCLWCFLCSSASFLACSPSALVAATSASNSVCSVCALRGEAAAAIKIGKRRFAGDLIFDSQ